MAIGHRLQLRQSQSLAMTPQLQQAIKLLQMSAQDVLEYVQQEVEQNPFLEGSDPDGAGGAAAAPASTDGAGPEADALDRWSAADWPGRSRSAGEPDSGLSDSVGAVAAAPSLRDHIGHQIRVDLAEREDRRLAFALLDGLDESGYLTVDPAQTARERGFAAARLEALLARLQRFDPPGLFARTLRECLAAQLADRGRLDGPMRALLDHLPLVAGGEVDRLVRLCAVDRSRVLQMVAELRCLDPKPGLRFQTATIESVVPEIVVVPRRGGGWAVTLNSAVLPKVLVNRSYHRLLSRSLSTREEKRYVDDQIRAASWLERALDQRARTVLAVASEIVRRQHGFLEEGPRRLRPMVLREVAEATELHESTVSRVTANKYIETPRGVFELKYFFTVAVSAVDGGESHAAEAVRTRIRTLVGAEDRSRPLSDDAIVRALRAEGIDLARRTAAKYREAMGIPSSVERRRAAKLIA